MTIDTRVATAEPTGAHTLEQVVIVGDLAKLTPADRVMYYQETCRSLGLNPLTKPFQYIVLNGRLTLYATRTATDQLRALRGISIDRIEQEEVAEIYTATVYGHDHTGRTDSDTGAVAVANLKGENRANAIMKAITKGKRRLTLSLAGLGWLDETEVASIPTARPIDVDQDTGEIHDIPPITEAIAAKRAAITNPTTTGDEEAPVSAGARQAIPAATQGSVEASIVPQGDPEPALPERCGAVPPEGGLDMTAPCEKPPGHGKLHRSYEGTWSDDPVPVTKP